MRKYCKGEAPDRRAGQSLFDDIPTPEQKAPTTNPPGAPLYLSGGDLAEAMARQDAAT